MEQYIAQFVALADGTKLTVLIGMVIANFLLGVAASIYTEEFRLEALADFLKNRVLPYIVTYFGVVVVAIVQPAWETYVTAVWGIIIAALVGHIAKNLKDMGLPLPDFIGGKK